MNKSVAIILTGWLISDMTDSAKDSSISTRKAIKKYGYLTTTLYLGSILYPEQIRSIKFILMKHFYISNGKLCREDPKYGCVDHYINGEKRFTYNYKDGKLHGSYIRYEGDKVLITCDYIDGKIHGNKTIYWEISGKIILSYNMGKLHDNVIEYYTGDEIIKSITPYVDGKKHGLKIESSPDGTHVISVKCYFKGNKYEHEEVYKPDGQTIKEVIVNTVDKKYRYVMVYKPDSQIIDEVLTYESNVTGDYILTSMLKYIGNKITNIYHSYFDESYVIDRSYHRVTNYIKATEPSNVFPRGLTVEKNDSHIVNVEDRS